MPFADLIRQLADAAPIDNIELSDDLDLYDEEEQARRLLRGYLIRARHCTRLLEYEDDAIRTRGLRLLTPAAMVHNADGGVRLLTFWGW